MFEQATPKKQLSGIRIAEAEAYRIHGMPREQQPFWVIVNMSPLMDLIEQYTQEGIIKEL
ncbi:MAG: hypothetical protein KTR14_07170 [Vampirovibrio sp.]|nr:hypothetical protein [Vampirovibrio sp.]